MTFDKGCFCSPSVPVVEPLPGAPRSRDRAQSGAKRFALAFASTLGLAAAPARAQAENQAAARALFDEGRALVKAGNAAAACPKFEGASHLYPSVGIALNLADCYERVGRTASAWTEFGEAASLAGRSDRPDDAAEARRRQVALEGKLTHLVLRAPHDIPGLSVKRDGIELPPAAWDSPIPVDPGPHEVRAEAPERTPWVQSVTAAGAGQTTTVEVPELAAAPPSANPEVAPATTSNAVPPTHPPADQGRGSSGARTAGWVLVGAGVAVGIGGGVLTGVEAGKASSANTAHNRSDYNSAAALWTVGIVGAVAGGVAAAVGVVLVVTSHGQEGGVALDVSPWFGAGVGGVRVGGCW